MSNRTQLSRARRLTPVLLPCLLLAGCGGEQETAAASGAGDGGSTGPEVRQVEVQGAEYEFIDVPPEAFPATYEIEFTNTGDEPHELSFVELEEGTTAESVIEAQEAGEDPETLVVSFLGTTGAVDPGSSGTVTVTLEDEKTYGYACTIATVEGASHATLGMVGDLIATRSAR